MLNRPTDQSADQPTYVTDNQSVMHPNMHTLLRDRAEGVTSRFISQFKNVFHAKYIKLMQSIDYKAFSLFNQSRHPS